MKTRYFLNEIKPIEIIMDDTTKTYVQLWDIVQNKEVLSSLLSVLTKLKPPVNITIKNFAIGCISLDAFDSTMNYYCIDLRSGNRRKGNLDEIEELPMICLQDEYNNYSEFEVLNALDCLYIIPTNMKNIQGGYNIHSKLN